MLKVIIAGSRTFNDLEMVEEVMKEFPDVSEVVCGCAAGADECGRQWADRHRIMVTPFPAEWDKYGRAAGYIRNTEMGDYADILVAFWDGKSRGTKHMIDYMKKLGKHGKVVLFNEL